MFDSNFIGLLKSGNLSEPNRECFISFHKFLLKASQTMRFTNNTCVFLFAAAAFVHRAQAQVNTTHPSEYPSSDPSAYPTSVNATAFNSSFSDYPSSHPSEYPSSDPSEYPTSVNSTAYPTSVNATAYPTSVNATAPPTEAVNTTAPPTPAPPPTDETRDCWATPGELS